MHPKTLLALCSFLFGLSGLTNAKPLFVIPTINERDLISLLVGGNVLPGDGTTPPSTPHTQTVSSIETNRLQASSVGTSGVTTPIHSLTSMAASLVTKSSFD